MGKLRNAAVARSGGCNRSISGWRVGENTNLAPGTFVVETQADNYQDLRLKDVLGQRGNGTGGLPYTIDKLPTGNAAINAFLGGFRRQLPPATMSATKWPTTSTARSATG